MKITGADLRASPSGSSEHGGGAQARGAQSVDRTMATIITQQSREWFMAALASPRGEPLPIFSILSRRELHKGHELNVSPVFPPDNRAAAKPDTAADLAAEVDEFVCLHTPPLFMAVGQWYEDFSQTTDEEVIELMRLAQGWGERTQEPSKQ